MKITLALAALVALTASLAQAQTRKGRETGYRYRGAKQAAPAAAPASKPRTLAPKSSRRRDEAPAEEQGPTPVPGALIRTAGVGTKTEPSASPSWTYFGDMGAPQGWGYAINSGGGRSLGGSGGGVRHGSPDGGRSSSGGATPFGTGGGNYQSWLNEGGNTTINGNAHNSNNGNGGGNGRGNGNGN
jgi:hypothetical protein